MYKKFNTDLQITFVNYVKYKTQNNYPVHKTSQIFGYGISMSLSILSKHC